MKTTLKELRAINDVLPLDICQQNILIFARRNGVIDYIRAAAERWEEEKKMEWSTPKRLRTDYSALTLGSANPAKRMLAAKNYTPSFVENLMPSPVPSNEDDEDVDDGFDQIAQDDLQGQSPSFIDRPVTPPLSQPTPTRARSGEKPPPPASGGARRNLLPELQDESMS